MAKAAIGVGAAMWGAKKLIDGMKAVIALAAEQQLAEKKLQAALGKTSKSLLNYAKELQKVTRYGDEVTLTAMTMIASFVKDEEAIKLATKATMDLAAAKGFDLVTAADLVSKTLGSTTNALTRYGIVVEGAVGSTERLNSMTENIAAVFGGQAQAQANTYTGKIDQMKNAIGDLGEAIGESLLPFLADMAESITGVVEDLTGMVGSMNAALEFEREGERIIAFRLLTDAIKENWENENLRKVMLKELKKEYPDYLGNLRNEEITLENINLLQEEGIKLFKMQQMEKLLTSYTEESMKKIVDGYVMIMEAETDQYALHKKLVYLSRGIFYDVPKTLGEAKIKEGTEEWEEYMNTDSTQRSKVRKFTPQIQFLLEQIELEKEQFLLTNLEASVKLWKWEYVSSDNPVNPTLLRFIKTLEMQQGGLMGVINDRSQIDNFLEQPAGVR